MSRIALLEDHTRLSELVRQALARASIVADVFPNMDSAWHATSQIAYGAFIVDRGLPDGDGLHFVKRLRDAGYATPCLMLTARDALHDRVEGLDGGADDYLTKPFPMEELIARVRALLRRPATLQESVYIYADLRLETDCSALRCDRQSLPLPITEFQIMLCLIRKPGVTVRRSALEAAAWGLFEAVTPNALDVAIHRLRRKMDDMKSRVQIVNVRGLGYALCEISIAE